jgi:hypothetical protein
VSGFRQINVLPSGTGQALSFTQGGAVGGSISVATASTGGAETRMKNANVYALIKL